MQYNPKLRSWRQTGPLIAANASVVAYPIVRGCQDDDRYTHEGNSPEQSQTVYQPSARSHFGTSIFNVSPKSPPRSHIDNKVGEDAMIRNLLLAGVVLLMAACVPITPEPMPEPTPEPTAILEPTPEPTPDWNEGQIITAAKENLADCPDIEKPEDFTSERQYDLVYVPVGQVAHDPTATNIPGYIDIVKVESDLDGEVLSVVFHLRDLPEEIELNRKGREEGTPEYMWLVYIDTDLEEEKEPDRFEYMFSAYSDPLSEKLGSSPAMQLLEEAVDVFLFEAAEGNTMTQVQTEVRLTVSADDNIIVLIGEVPGISAESLVAFTAFDPMRGYDTNSCPPN